MKKLLLIFIFLAVFVPAPFGQSADESLALGNPSGAKAKISEPDNYLVARSAYTLSYNKSRGAANWVEWHLSESDIRTGDRSNAVAPDRKLPGDWWIRPNDYTASGYDGGHLCPSKFAYRST